MIAELGWLVVIMVVVVAVMGFSPSSGQIVKRRRDLGGGQPW